MSHARALYEAAQAVELLAHGDARLLLEDYQREEPARWLRGGYAVVARWLRGGVRAGVGNKVRVRLGLGMVSRL